ncbi:gamma-glutamylcyclotransferase [Halomonas sp. SH5A2]|uniref:gamma-glutamylcyclotransferase family protein n=1 Tax=Halomonas sp. SH5A2 TaxID=2749040 RepID=UPI00163F687E|nr:gamma-glutamylcyclotransferase family protein [Halomonas sp. SH5A2]QNI03851.1 gamma-glutamylcyclotransferase [Halomonas sp. SH5A2]
MTARHLEDAVATTPLVAVYGTLKQGLNNAHWLSTATRLGVDSCTALTLYDIGPYPGAKWQASHGVSLEVYRVTASQLAHLDALEDHRHEAPEQGEYQRQLLATRFGQAWVYIYNPNVDERLMIAEGCWPPH